MPLFLEDPKSWVKVALVLNVYPWRSGHILLNSLEEEIRVYLLRASHPRSENILSDSFSLQTIQTIATKCWSSLTPPISPRATASCKRKIFPLFSLLPTAWWPGLTFSTCPLEFPSPRVSHPPRVSSGGKWFKKRDIQKADSLKGGEPQRGPEKPRELLLRHAFSPLSLSPFP